MMSIRNEISPLTVIRRCLIVSPWSGRPSLKTCRSLNWVKSKEDSAWARTASTEGVVRLGEDLEAFENGLCSVERSSQPHL